MATKTASKKTQTRIDDAKKLHDFMDKSEGISKIRPGVIKVEAPTSGPKIFRQGDVAMILREDLPMEVPKTAKVLKTRTLRRGENGGLHQLQKASGVVFYEDPVTKTRYVISENGVGLEHGGKHSDGGHHVVDLPRGHFEVRIQEEQTAQGTRQVID